VICPNYKLFNKGEICQKCKGGKYYHCFLGKCLKNSWGISFVAMAEAYIHKFLRSYEKVDCFLAPSRFMKDKCVEFGVPESKIKVLRNVLNMEEFRENKEFKEEEYFVYFGRISEEKGLKDLLQAIWKIKEKGRLGKNRLRIIGKGPQEDELARLIKKLHLEGEVSLEGFKKGEDLRNIIRKSKFTVLPSVWYDNSPMAVSEAQMLGKPVIVSDLGGTPEMVKDERTGFIFKARNVDDLADKISKMLQLSQKQRKDMGEVGRENIQEINNEDNYYNELVNIYKSFTS
jgi:glycosyltransferase involved in cell wall biosynthesis